MPTPEISRLETGLSGRKALSGECRNFTIITQNLVRIKVPKLLPKPYQKPQQVSKVISLWLI